jgi:hypothetical protein
VGKHGTKGNVTNSADVLDLSAVLLVDDQAATVVSFETDVVESKTGSVGTAADSDENDISVKLSIVSMKKSCNSYSTTYALGLATLGSLNVDLNALLGNLTGGHLGVELEVQTLLLEDLLSVLGDLLVHTGTTNLTKELNDGDLGAETRPDGSLCCC